MKLFAASTTWGVVVGHFAAAPAFRIVEAAHGTGWGVAAAVAVIAAGTIWAHVPRDNGGAS